MLRPNSHIPSSSEPAKIAIEGRRVTFSGELKFHENKTMYRDYEGEPVYFGPPSAEIDANWNALLEGSGLDLSGAEADSVKDWTFEEAQGGLWRTGYVFPNPTCRTVACLSSILR